MLIIIALSKDSILDKARDLYSGQGPTFAETIFLKLFRCCHILPKRLECILCIKFCSTFEFLDDRCLTLLPSGRLANTVRYMPCGLIFARLTIMGIVLQSGWESLWVVSFVTKYLEMCSWLNGDIARSVAKCLHSFVILAVACVSSQSHSRFAGIIYSSFNCKLIPHVKRD